MNITFNYTPVVAQPMADRLNCSAGLQDYLNSTSETLNLFVVVFFVVYVLLLFASQYLLERKQITLSNYVLVHFWVNNTMVALAIMYLIYALLLA